MNIVNRVYGTLTVVFFALGIWLHIVLGELQNIELFKLLNVVGIFFDICGVLLLSHMVTSVKPRYGILFDVLYGAVMIGMFSLSMGLIIGNIASLFMELPSTKVVVVFGGGIVSYMLIPLYIMDSLADTFKFKFYETYIERTKFLGWYLLGSGLTIQLIASVYDLLG